MGVFKRSKLHLDSIDESYFEHCFFALRYAFGCFQAGFMVLVHALIPAFFVTAGGDKIEELAGKRRQRDEEG